MNAPYRSHDAAMAESFRNDPAFAAEYLNSILEDGDQAELLIALRQIAEAFGGVQHVARVVVIVIPRLVNLRKT